jgi:hypothetical protein
MKIAVLVPTPEYINNAGARIRYLRLASNLARSGNELTLLPIGEFTPEDAEADVVVLSKCHDPVSLVIAAKLADRGIPIGVDLFDDYFSQSGDSRLARFRLWLAQILFHSDFVLCSTEVMAEIADRYRPGIAAHVMNDPAVDVHPGELSQVLTGKLRQAVEGQQIRIAWFGVGDNPYFPVGLRDLASFGGVLQEFSRTGADVELHVLTNRRALTFEGLAGLRTLPIRSKIEEWTEDLEREVLSSAFAAFLPVNNQAFSTAKSLNRAVTALTSGCQVVSVGYPLYEKLEPLIYRDATEFVADFAQRKMRLSAGRMNVYREAINNYASADAEATRLVNFLASVGRRPPDDETLVVLHGHSTSGAAHKLVQRLNGLSVASPCCTTVLGFDVVFRLSATGLLMLVSEKASRRLQRAKSRLVPHAGVAGSKYLELRDDAAPTGDPPARAREEASLPLQLAGYGRWMEEMRSRVSKAFGQCRFIIAETSRLPFSVAD